MLDHLCGQQFMYCTRDTSSLEIWVLLMMQFLYFCGSGSHYPCLAVIHFASLLLRYFSLHLAILRFVVSELYPSKGVWLWHLTWLLSRIMNPMTYAAILSRRWVRWSNEKHEPITQDKKCFLIWVMPLQGWRKTKIKNYNSILFKYIGWHLKSGAYIKTVFYSVRSNYLI